VRSPRRESISLIEIVDKSCRALKVDGHFRTPGFFEKRLHCNLDKGGISEQSARNNGWFDNMISDRLLLDPGEKSVMVPASFEASVEPVRVCHPVSVPCVHARLGIPVASSTTREENGEQAGKSERKMDSGGADFFSHCGGPQPVDLASIRGKYGNSRDVAGLFQGSE
jgi:hypothetical protein